MNRRAFLKLITPLAAGAVLDPERLLWVPGKVFAFLGGGPVPVAFQIHPGANRLMTPDWVTKEIAREFVRSIGHLKAINAHYDRQFVEVGNTVHLRLPERMR